MEWFKNNILTMVLILLIIGFIVYIYIEKKRLEALGDEPSNNGIKPNPPIDTGMNIQPGLNVENPVITQAPTKEIPMILLGQKRYSDNNVGVVIGKGDSFGTVIKTK